MVGISSKAAGKLDNKFDYNGKEKQDKEFDDGSGLGLYDSGSRFFDPQIGRWHSCDPLAGKWITVSPYVYTLNTPTNALDPDGRDVYFIVNTNGGGDLSDAAKTRQKEIEGSKKFNKKKDHVYVLNISDLGQLKDKVKESVKDAAEKGFGKTVELSVFSHSASDGPRGEMPTSENSLSEVTGDPLDRAQLSPDAWKSIDFNFDPNGNIAAFYGCNTDGFAQKFLDYQPTVTYTAGMDGKSGGSYSSKGDYDGTWLNILNRNVYMVTVTNPSEIGRKGNTSVMPKNVFKRGFGQFDTATDVSGNTYSLRSAFTQIYGNVTVGEKDKNGSAKPISGSKNN